MNAKTGIKSIEAELEVVSIDVILAHDGIPKTATAESETTKRSGVLLILIGIAHGIPGREVKKRASYEEQRQ
jgi:methyl coenzyme M reductase subunit C-like uncharacterized protein (methanogenesis marker protein 7)